MHKYLNHTPEDLKAMLEAIGKSSVDELFTSIPENVALDRPLDLPDQKSELEVRRILHDLADQNQEGVCFLGAGAYDHYIPSVIDALISRGEFYTSYTPYQPEISQGTLQYIFEYQTMMCRLTGMEVANASVYDGSNAIAEAAMLAYANAKKGKVAYSQTLNPSYQQVLKTYAHASDVELVEIPEKEGRTDLEAFKAMDISDICGCILQSPNYYGIIEEVKAFSEVIHQNKRGTMVLATDPLSLGILEAPGKLGVDVTVGEAQCFGIPMSFGGPYVGFMTSTSQYMRKLPGRIAGQTVDKRGQRSFVLTLTAREQHIRRARATSNICSNQGLNTLVVAIYLSLMGKRGIQEVANQSLQKAHYLADQLEATGHFKLKYQQPFFKEFVITSELTQKEAQQALLEAGIFGATPVEGDDHAFLVAVTEKRTKEEMDAFVKALEVAYDQKL